MTSSPFPIQKTRSFEEIVSDTFRFLHFHGKSLGGNLLKIVSPVLLLEGLLTLILSSSPDTEAVTTLNRFSMFFAFVMAVLVQTTVACYFVLYIDDPTRTISTGELWHNVRLFIGRVCITSLLYGILSAIGLLFFVFPGVYLIGAGALSAIVVVQEDSSPSTAISRSLRLTQEYWWPTLGLLLLSLFLQFVVNIVGEISHSLVLSSYTIALDNSTFINALIALSTLVSGVISLAGMLIPAITLTFQYYNLVERKEARGLQKRISEIEPSDSGL